MDGALIIDKPAGITSHTVVAKVRRALRMRRVGHAGTLDPFATGVLVVCLGRATRLVQFLVGLDKQYVATVRLGFATDTQDLTGKQITPLMASDRLSLEDVLSVLNEFRGLQLQTPPMFSAKKVGGERLYRAARQGREVEREPVPVTVYSIEPAGCRDGQLSANEDGTRDFEIVVRCSSGTYVRTLAHDIGGRLGVGAHLAALRRTAVGRFEVASAVSLEDLERQSQEGGMTSKLISPADLIAHLPAMVVDARQARMIANGRELEAESFALRSGGQPVRLLDERGVLVAVAELDPDRKTFRPRIVLEAGV